MEELDDVLGYNLKIYQRRDWFCFSLDSVLLANFVPIKLSTKKILELGSGNGIIPLILTLRTDKVIEGVEIQEDLFNLAEKSIKYNKLEDKIKLRNIDIKNLLLEKEKYNTYDLLICNPPYFSNLDKSTKNDNIHKTIARHEIKRNLEDILKVTNRLLKDRGVFSIINRTDRLIEIINIFKKYNIEPKKIKFIHKNVNSESTMVYIEGIKNGSCGLKIDSPFYIYNVDGSESDKYLEICKEVLK